MGSRALRKVQRKLKENKVSEDSGSGSDEFDLDIPAQKRQHQPLFSLLQAEGDDHNEDSIEHIEEQSESEDDHNSSRPRIENNQNNTTATKKKSKKKKKKKKANDSEANRDGKIKVTEKQNGSDEDDLDALLQSLSTSQVSQSHTPPTASNPYAAQLQELLAVESKHLHTSTEIRKLFGSSAVEEELDDNNAAQQPGRQGRGAGRHGGRQQTLSSVSLKRNTFIHGKEGWPRATSGGLGMEVEKNENDDTVMYKFVHSRGYQDVQMQFLMCVESMDPERLVQLLHFNPYHISTILQVSQIFKQQGDHTMSGELIERALFSFGRSLHSKFPSNMSKGRARLDFRRPENRELWLTAWRYINNLGMRGLWRTAFEWGKLLLSFDPEEDRYRLVLIIDQLALRARQSQTLISLIESSFFRNRWRSHHNIAFAHGLAYFQVGEVDKSKELLASAIKRFPWVIARLFQELNIEKLPPSIWGKFPPTPGDEFFTNLYIIRAKDLWNSPETVSLLLEVAKNTNHEREGEDREEAEKIPTSLDVIRYAILTDNAAIIRNLPVELTAESLLPTDPISPVDNLPSYHLETHPSLAAATDDAQKKLVYQQNLYQEYCRAVGGEQKIGDEAAMKEACVTMEKFEEIKDRIARLEDQVTKEKESGEKKDQANNGDD